MDTDTLATLKRRLTSRAVPDMWRADVLALVAEMERLQSENGLLRRSLEMVCGETSA